METINGCTVIPRSEAGELVNFGPSQMDGAYRVLAGTIPPGTPAPPFHVHPHTDEAFYVAAGEASFLRPARCIGPGSARLIGSRSHPRPPNS